MDLTNIKDKVSIKVQPILDMKDYAVVCYEILSSFISNMEIAGFFVDNNKYYLNSAEILDRVLSKCKISPGKKLAVNINENEIMNPALIKGIITVCARHNFPLSDIVVEISEEFSANSMLAVESILNNIKASGITLALDDYGAGRKISEQALRRFPFSIIKFDRLFLSNASDETTVTNVLTDYMQIARALNCKTVIEGIENTNDLKVALEAGFDMGQGYFLGLPRNIKEISGNGEIL
ncbi:MAG: EAL domain-containing protein [Holosporales bacterium]|jgi:EAL domain-containing protein (putative c-di-GMP-specific phosphodiesterase class I)|nr:EAL domain-containing protein [Holosporales bacterium]